MAILSILDIKCKDMQQVQKKNEDWTSLFNGKAWKAGILSPGQHIILRRGILWAHE